jgi:hypothetical protein
MKKLLLLALMAYFTQDMVAGDKKQDQINTVTSDSVFVNLKSALTGKGINYSENDSVDVIVGGQPYNVFGDLVIQQDNNQGKMNVPLAFVVTNPVQQYITLVPKFGNSVYYVFNSSLSSSLQADSLAALIKNAPTGVGPSYIIPIKLDVSNAFPNPFNPSTSISYNLPEQTTLSLSVYDLNGREIRSLFKGTLQSGGHKATWDGRDNSGSSAASGTYFFMLRTEKATEIRKALLVK